MHVLTVTASDDGTKKGTYEVLLEVFREARNRGLRVFFWSSTPCTGGCPYQRLNLNRYGTEYQKHLDGLWSVHRKLWSVVKTMCAKQELKWPELLLTSRGDCYHLSRDCKSIRHATPLTRRVCSICARAPSRLQVAVKKDE